jgi:hypothetical protein
MKTLGIVSILLALSGCASTQEAEQAPAAAGAWQVAESVTLCRTTLAELRTQLGTPSRDGRLGKATVVTWILEWEPLTKYLGVMANDAGTVVDVVWNLPSEVTWTPTDRCR